MLSNPTDLTVDERGRVWVLEGVNYRRTSRNLPDLRPAGDRIVILEDTDQDGRADKVKVFDQSPQIRVPLGIAVLGDKVYVSQAPDLIVYTKDADDNIVMNYIATSALYHPETKAWELQTVKVVHYDETGNITKTAISESLMITDWSETPYRLSSANLRAEYLSVPELRDYLHFNSDFPETLLAPFATHLQYRVALPWTCLVVTLIATSLGVGYSRRGVLSSVAAAIMIVFAMNFVMHLFLALGEGARIPDWAAAWTPNVFFGALGLVLLYYRATNREPPRLNLFGEGRVFAR